METLTFEKKSGTKQWRRQSFVVLGAPKLGKSELFAAGEGSLFLDIEGGLNHLEVMKFPKDRPFVDYDELEGYIDQLVALKQGGKFPANVDTVVFDTATRLVNLATEKALELLNNKHKDKNWQAIEEVTIGGDKGNPGWALRTNLVDNLIGKAKQLGCAIVIIAHMDTKKAKVDVNGTMVELDRQTISIGGNLGKAFLNNADHILNMVSKTESNGIINRVIRTLNTPTIEAGSRGLCIPDKWEMVSPKARTREAMKEASDANYKLLRSYFAE